MIDGELLGCLLFSIIFLLYVCIYNYVDRVRKANYYRFIFNCKKTIKMLNGGQTITTDMED